MITKTEKINGLPAISVNGIPLSEMAYITYIPDNNRYGDFAKAGVKLYSVNLNFSEMPINERAPVLVFQKGIFEKEEPDFGIVDRNFEQILEACPDAYIFPRVNMNLPESWEQAHPDELCEKGFNGRNRFSYASDLWADEVKKRLAELVNYIENGKYKDRVIGYQLAAGNTEEWLSIDPQSGYGIRAKEKFSDYCEKNGAEKNAENYYNFMSELVASRIAEFAAEVKRLTKRKKLVGSFYGYTLFVGRAECHNALGKILACDDIDFLCSPVAYADGRAAGIDPYAMIPTASVRHHGKLYFSENDIRTHLSKPVHDHPNYTLPIWYGHEKSVSLEQLKLSFCRAMLYGYGMWWFDMWGGWYSDPEYMELMKKMSELCQNGMDRPDADVAAFIDERAVTKGVTGGMATLQGAMRAIGLCGTPCDMYLTSDFDAVFDKYKVCIFIEPAETVLSCECAKKAEMAGRTVKRITAETPVLGAELHTWLKENGIDVPVSRSAVVYRSEKYIMLYTPEDGEYNFSDFGKSSFVDLFTGETVNFPTLLPKFKCFLFERGQK
ncbi:MAG: hypothetical protein IJW79_00490 [Clostridia bacterium]|nr:hypothetical protein [Clostridia bacterium]